ncbi:D-alanyl-D-alanine carboxypeptidase [Actinoalloteichus hoggarensis]|uniref:D-alanyl-D-alanine carboxypeptidase n=1 Tax=Actinoalloteichus hoggarensis TaxID=1470176 RepID=A0A221W6H4_9PSEU|nr:serine hydrolase domain-containing protein [Actinoalloteichus hoggarensis]ASO21179.1 D-alanyl-D-alanine carboxypeptidase precursor [Actinoalloteichus hoggarensis]MBB5921108.1 D-alanyl-D-alanine carboxypeptidase [Actinoalloteichus hoggarensis]
MGPNRRRLVGIAGAVTLALGVAVAPPAAVAQDEHAATQAALDLYREVGGPGAAVYAGDVESAWTLTSGTAKIGQQRPITTTDHFRHGSQSKTFTAAVVMQLVDEGLVALDTPIETYLPGVVTDNYDGGVITTRQLLAHTSGMVRDPRDARPSPDGTFELAELVRSAMDEPPQDAPGASVRYSNVGYLVLGLLIEELTGKPVGDVITERIIEPLGLEGTSFPARGERALRDPFVPGYLIVRVPPLVFWTEVTTSTELSVWAASGGMESTLEDSVRFFQALLAGDVVSESALAEMRDTVPYLNGYGMGLGLNDRQLSCGGTAWFKHGALGTGHTSVTAVTDDGRFASLVTNAMVTTEVATARADAVLDAALCE